MNCACRRQQESVGSSPTGGWIFLLLPPEQTGGKLGETGWLHPQQRVHRRTGDPGKAHRRVRGYHPLFTTSTVTPEIINKWEKICLFFPPLWLVGKSDVVCDVMSHLQEVISSISGAYSRSILWRSSEALTIRLQALCRGFLIRRQLEARQRYLISQTPAVIVIQVRTQLTVEDSDWVTVNNICLCLCFCSVSVEEVHPAEGLQTTAAVSLHELESSGEGQEIDSVFKFLGFF